MQRTSGVNSGRDANPHGNSNAALLFSASILALSLTLQRFAFPIGEHGVDVVGPIGLFIAVVGVFCGAFIIDRRRLVVFMLLMLYLAASSSYSGMVASPTKIHFSVSSLMQFLFLNSFCILSFSDICDEAAFFRLISGLLAVIAASGLLQFFLQFVGVSFFSFSHMVPDSLLFEGGYNVVIPVGIGLLNKANGMFLLEPSIFSQIMAMGLIIEILTLKRVLFLLLFMAAMLVAFSGTGIVVLGAFLASAVVKLGKQGAWLSVTALVLIAAVAVTVFYAAPDFAQVFTSRMNEINSPGSSGYDRFRTPFLALQQIWDHDDRAWLIGIGAGATSRMTIPFEYVMNTPIKLVLEYGLPALVIYTTMILTAKRTRTQAALVLPSVVLLFMAGENDEFAPILFPVFLLICVARLRPGLDHGPETVSAHRLAAHVAETRNPGKLRSWQSTA